MISTRTPRVGSDGGASRWWMTFRRFQPARVGSDRNILSKGYVIINILNIIRQTNRMTSIAFSVGELILVRTSFVRHDRLQFAPTYSAKNPSASYVGFAPMCSIFV